MKRWRNPRDGFMPWATCQTCGQAFLANLVWYNPRWGWQCHYCWDGLIQRDQILQPIFPYEGTRKTPAPVVPADQGIGAYGVSVLGTASLYTLYDWADPTTTYNIEFTDPIQFFSPALTDCPAADRLILNNGWYAFIKSGFLGFQNLPRDNPNAVTWAGSGDFFVDANEFLVYTPYVQETVAPYTV